MSARAPGVVAVVDDDPRILESLEDLLESAGYDVRLHGSGGSLLASDISKIDCLVTDIGMPVIDGLELRTRVKRVRPELPVLLISGKRELTEIGSVEELGVGRFFRKPFDGHALLAAIAESLQ